ncbi:hypothetical protein ACUH9O_01920 [Dermabacteraceae bacterium P13103]
MVSNRNAQARKHVLVVAICASKVFAATFILCVPFLAPYIATARFVAEVFPAILLSMSAFLAVLTLCILLPLRRKRDRSEENSRLWLFPCASFVFVLCAAAAFGSWHPVNETPGQNSKPGRVFSWEKKYKSNHLALIDAVREKIDPQLNTPTDG